MAGEKYIVATSENPVQIAVRNMINPSGYFFIGNCADPSTMLRLIRSLHPDFAVVDTSMPPGELTKTLQTIDGELLCACIVLDNQRSGAYTDLVAASRILHICVKPVNPAILLNTIGSALLNFRRITDLDMKLRTMTDNYETRKQVERAKWIIMEREGLSETQAYEKMRKRSMDTRTPMKIVAKAIIMTYDMYDRN